MNTILLTGVAPRLVTACRDAGYAVVISEEIDDRALREADRAIAIVASAEHPRLATLVGRAPQRCPLLLLARDELSVPGPVRQRAIKLLQPDVEPGLLLFELRAAIARNTVTVSSVEQKMRGLWEQYRGLNLGRVENLERILIQLLSGRDDSMLEEARREVHKLAGVLGSFGFERASEEALELQRALDASIAGGELDVNAAAQRVMTIRDDITHGATSASPQEPAGETVLIIERDAGRAASLMRAVSEEGLRPIHCDNFAGARSSLLMHRPRGVIIGLEGLVAAAPYLDRGSEEPLDDALLLVSEVADTAPFVAIVVLSPSLALTRRIQAVRGGAALFMDHREPASIVAKQVQRLFRLATRRVRVLALDDDIEILELLREVLPKDLIDLVTVSDAEGMWHEVESACPDVVLLDVEMPKVNGIELCRALRADPRFMSLPILVLTSLRSAKAVSEVFAAGADDFLMKPVIASEVISRIMNRLHRIERLRESALRDSEVPFMAQSVALVRVGQTRQRAAARELRFSSASVARWTEDTMIVLSREHASVLEQELNEARARPGGALSIAVAAVAELRAGGGLADIARSLETTILEPETDGSVRRLTQSVDPGVDILIVEDEETVAGLLTFMLQSRGYTTHWIRDGLEAAEHLIGHGSPAPRVVLLDIDLPSLDGLSVLRRLAKGDHLSRMRVLIVSVRAAESEVVAALESGAFDHIAKPFSLAVLAEKVRKAFES